MRTSRSRGLAALLVAAGVALTACQTASAEGSGADAAAQAAVLQPAANGGPGRITLSAAAEKRLGLATVAVGPGPEGIPYSAVVYDNQGAAWAFARVAERVYQRTPLTIRDIVGDRALLLAGPARGTEVVTVGAAELVGVEAGISGGQ